MKKKLIFLLILTGFLGLVIGLVKLLSSRTPKIGVLKVNSSPVANIFINNKHIGKTPYEDKIDAAEYEIKLVPESTLVPSSSWQGKIKVDHNLLTFVNAELTDSEFTSAVEIIWLEKISAKNGQVSLTTQPDGASVSLDGELKGSSPLLLSDVTAGVHNILLVSPGFMSRSLKVKVTPGYKLLTTTKLALSSSSAVESTAVSSPAAEILPEPLADDEKPATATAISTDPEKPYIEIKDTPTGFLRVRMEPNTSATEAAQVKPGDKFGVIEKSDNGWYKIKYLGDDEGWVSGTYAQLYE